MLPHVQRATTSGNRPRLLRLDPPTFFDSDRKRGRIGNKRDGGKTGQVERHGASVKVKHFVWITGAEELDEMVRRRHRRRMFHSQHVAIFSGPSYATKALAGERWETAMESGGAGHRI